MQKKKNLVVRKLRCNNKMEKVCFFFFFLPRKEKSPLNFRVPLRQLSKSFKEPVLYEDQIHFPHSWFSH